MMTFTSNVDLLSPIQTSPDQLTQVFALPASSSISQPILLKRVLCPTQSALQAALRTVTVVQSNPHPNISPYVVCQQEEARAGQFFLYTAIPAPSLTLRADIETRAARSMRHFDAYYSESTLWKYAKGLTAALSFLQQNKIPVVSLTPDCVFIGSADEVQISDFGLAVRRIDRKSPGNETSGLKGAYPSQILTVEMMTGKENEEKRRFNEEKSGVFALGMCLMHATTLEFPGKLADLTNAERNFDDYFREMQQRLAERYSEKWLFLLRAMLSFNENVLPDLIQLKSLLENYRLFDDDQPVSPTGSLGSADLHLEVAIQYGLKYVCVGLNQSEKIPCILTLKSRCPVPAPRLSTDFICLVDESGSMSGPRLSLVQGCLHEFLGLLGPSDRVSVIGFSDQAVRKCSLTRCDEDGKDTIRREIDDLESLDETNIGDGLRMAINVAVQRKVCNSAVALLLFTDGVCSEGQGARQQCQELMLAHQNLDMHVHCFGLGPDVDIDLLQAIAPADACHYVNTPDSLRAGLLSVLSSLFPVVARDIRVSVFPASPVPVACRLPALSVRMRALSFNVPVLFSAQQTQFSFELEVKKKHISHPYRFSPIEVKVAYKDADGIESPKEARREIKFVQGNGDCGEEDGEVMAAWRKEKVAESIREVRTMVDQRRYSDAEARIAKEIATLQMKKMEMISELKTVSELLKLQGKWSDAEKIRFLTIYGNANRM